MPDVVSENMLPLEHLPPELLRYIYYTKLPIADRLKMPMSKTLYNALNSGLGLKLRFKELFPNVKILAKKPTDISEMAGFWKDMIQDVGAQYVKSFPHREQQEVAKALFRYDIEGVKSHAGAFLKSTSGELIKIHDEYDLNDTVLVIENKQARMALNRCTDLRQEQDIFLIRDTPTIIKEGKYEIYPTSLLEMALHRGMHQSLLPKLKHVNDFPNISTNAGVSPFWLACQSGRLEYAKFLLENGAEQVQDGSKRTPFWIACANGHQDIVELLITKDATVVIDSVDSQNVTPLHVASKHGHDKIALFLINKGATVTPDIFKQLCEKGCVDTVTVVLKAYENQRLNLSSDDINKAFHLACINGQLKVAKLLLTKINIGERQAQLFFNPIFLLACENNHVDVADFLMEKQSGLDVNSCSASAKSSLWHACSNNNYDLAEALIRKGACVNPKSIAIDSPLYLACEKGNLKLAKLLIINGANVCIKSPHTQMSPLDIAKSKGHRELVVLLSACARVENHVTCDAVLSAFETYAGGDFFSTLCTYSLFKLPFGKHYVPEVRDALNDVNNKPKEEKLSALMQAMKSRNINCEKHPEGTVSQLLKLAEILTGVSYDELKPTSPIVGMSY